MIGYTSEPILQTILAMIGLVFFIAIIRYFHEKGVSLRKRIWKKS